MEHSGVNLSLLFLSPCERTAGKLRSQNPDVGSLVFILQAAGGDCDINKMCFGRFSCILHGILYTIDYVIRIRSPFGLLNLYLYIFLFEKIGKKKKKALVKKLSRSALTMWWCSMQSIPIKDGWKYFEARNICCFFCSVKPKVSISHLSSSNLALFDLILIINIEMTFQ